MSAFMCSDKHLHTVAQFIHREAINAYIPRGLLERLTGDHYPTEHAIALALKHANAFNVASLYPLTEARAKAGYGEQFPVYAEPGRASEASEHLSREPLLVIKSAKCVDYQSSDLDGWEGSAGQKVLQAVIDRAIMLLPGFDDLPWGIA